MVNYRDWIKQSIQQLIFLVLGRKNNCVFPNCLRRDANIKRFWIGFQSQLISVVPELQPFVGCCEVLWLGTVPVSELFCNLAFTLSSYFMNTTTLILETERKLPSHLLPISLCLCEPFTLGFGRVTVNNKKYFVACLNVTPATFEMIRLTVKKLDGGKRNELYRLWMWSSRTSAWEFGHSWIKICWECSSCSSHVLLSDRLVAVSNSDPFGKTGLTYQLEFVWSYLGSAEN